MGKSVSEYEHRLETLFLRLLARLRDAYYDPTPAKNFDGGGGQAAHGHRILWAEEDAGLRSHLNHWLWRWWTAHDTEHQENLIREAYRELDSFRKRRAPVTPLWANTQEWRKAIAQTKGTPKQVAEEFGVTPDLVASAREEFHGRPNVHS